jgi:hypothetical protein
MFIDHGTDFAEVARGLTNFRELFFSSWQFFEVKSQDFVNFSAEFSSYFKEKSVNKLP